MRRNADNKLFKIKDPDKFKLYKIVTSQFFMKNAHWTSQTQMYKQVTYLALNT